MNFVFLNDCAADGCRKRNKKGYQLCEKHQAEYNSGKALKAFYGKTIQKKEFQKVSK